MRLIVLSCTLLLLSFSTQAGSIKIGESLATLVITDKGEINTAGKYKQWSSKKISRKPKLIFYLAGRMSAQRMITPLTDQLKSIKSPKYHTTTIINGSDVTLGATALVRNELLKNKKAYPESSIVYDARGKGLQLWALKKASAATIILDKNNKVVFFKEGKLTADNVATVLSLLK